MSPPPLESLRVFRAVAELRSFSRASERLRMDKSQVSRVVRALEGSLGRELLIRTTRSVRLSSEGAQLLRRITPALGELDEALRPDESARAPEGRVVLTTTADLGQTLVAPHLVRFRLLHPRVNVEVRLSDAVEDLLADDVDLALRVGRPGPGSLVARKLGELEAGLYAAPSYLERRGVPTRPEELATHEGLWPRPPRGRAAFAAGKSPPEAAIESADFGLLSELARAGGGIALLPTHVAAPWVSGGALVRVLPSFALGSAPLYLVSRAVRTLPPRVLALREQLSTLRVRGADHTSRNKTLLRRRRS